LLPMIRLGIKMPQIVFFNLKIQGKNKKRTIENSKWPWLVGLEKTERKNTYIREYFNFIFRARPKPFKYHR
jgi:hypothetical protein